jgi:small subunit ribosomal protein S7
MSRRNKAPKRDVLPDPKFNSKNVTKFINHIMLSGKKSVAEKIVYGAFKKISKVKLNEKSIDIFEKALNIVSPMVEVKFRRIGGATYQIPIEVRSDRQKTLAMRWIVDSARKRKGGKGMSSYIADELLDIIAGRGSSFKKREDIHKMAESNKAFAHFRW